MLYWVIVFLVISLVAGALGFGGISSAAAGVSKILFFVFLVLAALTVLLIVTGVSLVG